MNLAVDMVHDAHVDRLDTAVLSSNDSDFLRALQIVRRDVGKAVGVVNPQQHRQSRQLRDAASFVKTVRRSDLTKNELPDRVQDDRGTIYRPKGW